MRCLKGEGKGDHEETDTADTCGRYTAWCSRNQKHRAQGPGGQCQPDCWTQD